jgi:hypothetical protein
MRRFVPALLLLAVSLSGIRAGGVLVAQPPRAPSTFGAGLKPVPPLLVEHLPQLKNGRGLAVERVQPNSSAEKTGLRVHDILLNYDGTDLTNSKQLHDLLRGCNPEHPGTLSLLRQGQQMKVAVVLAPSPANQTGTATSAVKRGGPPAINVKAVPMQKGRWRVTFEFYADQNSGKLQQLTCTGSPQEIEQCVEELPEPLQDLARVAVQRLRK